jgi:hypothetical protein
MAEHAAPARKPAAPAASAKAPAAARPGGLGEVLNRRSEAALAGCAQLLADRAAANPLTAPLRAPGPQPVQLMPNRTGLPDGLKAGVEALSGLAMDDVRVHRNSSAPAKLGALAYAQGSDIHLGPGQDRHLPHEAWHVVQQKQGRVQATAQMKSGVAINDDKGLELEADRMASAAVGRLHSPVAIARPLAARTGVQPVQRYTRIGNDRYLASEGLAFESQSLGTGTHRAGYVKRTGQKPGLKISKDHSLGIQADAAQAKSFLASDAVIAASNARLNSTDSPICLTKIGGVVFTNALLANVSWKQKDQVATQASIGMHICNETASKISGGISQLGALLVMQPVESRDDPTTERTATMSLTRTANPVAAAMLEPTTADAVKHDQEGNWTAKRAAVMEEFKSRVEAGKVESDAVRYFLPEVAITPALIARYKATIDAMYLTGGHAVTEDELKRKTGQLYGRLAPDVHEERSKALGINSYALPDVGEALATFPVADQDFTGKHPKYLAEIERLVTDMKITAEVARAQLDKVDVNGWTWHFASVVAKSGDGRDYVTLENYNRGPDYETEIRRVHANLAGRFHDFKDMAEHTDFLYDDAPDELHKMLNHLDHGFQYASLELGLALEEASESLQAFAILDKGTAWYFSMFGPAAETVGGATQDQSFHAAMAASGDFANPVTLRFRGAALQKNRGKAPAGDKKIDEAQQHLHAVGEAIAGRQPTTAIARAMKQAEAAIAAAKVIYEKDPLADPSDAEAMLDLIQLYYDQRHGEFRTYLMSLKRTEAVL